MTIQPKFKVNDVVCCNTDRYATVMEDNIGLITSVLELNSGMLLSVQFENKYENEWTFNFFSDELTKIGEL